MSQIHRVDVLIIGAGPAGISALAECVYHDVGSIMVLEKGPTHNQTIHKYYPDHKRVDAAYKGQEAICAGVLCFRDTTKPNFIYTIDKLLELYPAPIVYNCHVESIKKQTDGSFMTTDSSGNLYQSFYVIVTIGRMGKPNKPDYFKDIPTSIRSLLKFDICNLIPQGQEVLVVGGGNSAIEYVLSLAGDGAKVTVSYRKPDFSRLNPMNQELLFKDEADGKIKILRQSNISTITEDKGRPKVHFQEKQFKPMIFDLVIFGIGGSSPAGFLQNAGLELDAKGNPILNEWHESSQTNLFVGGELSVAPGKGSIIVSFNSGKLIVEAIMKKMGKKRKPEIVTLHYHYVPESK